MPITKLFVEGDLDSEILVSILKGSPVLQVGGSKNALRPRARAERQDTKRESGYLRDRDFDFDPPEDLSRPTPDAEDDSNVFGWRWCRHEIENYLIDPGIVNAATGYPIADIEQAIRLSAMEIRSYEAARWTVGIVRRALPPQYELKTRPDALNEIDIPQAVDTESVTTWAKDNIDAHRTRIVTVTDPANTQASLDSFFSRFDETFIANVLNVIIWFSGKDLLAGMQAWLRAKGYENPGSFRARIRDWIIANPERTLELLPEWNRLTQILRS